MASSSIALLAVVPLLAASGAAGAQAQTVERSFSDWHVTCDNTRHCVAMSGDSEAGHVIMLKRDAGPEADPTVSVFGGALPVHGPGHDPVHYPSPAWEQVAGGLDGDVLRTSKLPAAQAFIDAVRNSDALRSAPGKDQDEGAVVSLKGFSAALLLVDEVQGRLGTRGALLRRGKAPESTVPAAPEMPVLRRAPVPRELTDAQATAIASAVRKSQAAVLEAEDCDADTMQDQATALTDTKALVFLGCWMGAYQGSGPLFVADRKAPHAATRLVLDNPADGKAMDMLTSATYSPETATLDHWGKGRGLGDCGQIAHWVFDGERFHLKFYASMPRCAGVLPDHWPTRWQARVEDAQAPR